MSHAVMQHTKNFRWLDRSVTQNPWHVRQCTAPSSHPLPSATTHPQRSQAAIRASSAHAEPATLHRQHDSPLVSLMRGQAKLTHAAQLVWGQVVQPGETVVDATCGNGHDTLALARMVGPSGTVHGFDIQQVAIDSTRTRLERELPSGSGATVHLHRQCHSQMVQVVGAGTASCVVFNLGYLPSGDKGLVTQTNTSIAAIQAALDVIKPGGLVSVMLYHGHEEGGKEVDAVHALVATLPPSHWVVSQVALLNRPLAPFLVNIWKRDDAA